MMGKRFLSVFINCPLMLFCPYSAIINTNIERVILLKILLLVFMLLASLVSPTVAANAQDSTYTFAISSDPLSVNPINSSDRWGLTYTNMAFSPLLRISGDGSEKFELAESYTVSEDGLEVSVILKEDVLWSDGEPFTADDVVFTYTTKANPDNGNSDSLWFGESPVEVEKVSDYEVKFVLPEASPAVVTKAVAGIYIIPEHIFGEFTDFSGSELPADPVGTGAYKVEEYRRGEYISFVANENYYGDPANIDRVVLQIIGNIDTAKAALQTGEIDAGVFTPRDLQTMDTENLDSYSYTEGRVGYIGLNSRSEALQDPNVRKAIMFALNRDELNTAVYLSDEYYNNAYSIIPSSNPFYTEDLEKYEHNLEMAQQLLEEAGNPQVNLKMAVASDDANQALVGPLVQQELSALGISVELVSSDLASIVNENLTEGSTTYDLFVGGYIMGIEPSAYNALYASNGHANFFGYSNEDVDALFNEGAYQLDLDTRKETYAEIQRLIADDAVVYPLVDNLRVIVSNPRIGGYEEAKFVPIYNMEDWSQLTIQ